MRNNNAELIQRILEGMTLLLRAWLASTRSGFTRLRGGK